MRSSESALWSCFAFAGTVVGLVIAIGMSRLGLSAPAVLALGLLIAPIAFLTALACADVFRRRTLRLSAWASLRWLGQVALPSTILMGVAAILLLSTNPTSNYGQGGGTPLTLHSDLTKRPTHWDGTWQACFRPGDPHGTIEALEAALDPTEGTVRETLRDMRALVTNLERRGKTPEEISDALLRMFGPERTR